MNPNFLTAEDLGVKLEIVGDLPVWEASPVYKHQKAVDHIRATLKKSGKTKCECVHVADVYVQFPDGSLKRPDISVFCREPKEEEEAITLIPEAVIEVISKKYEAKDLKIGVPFYISQGVKDVVVFNPYTMEVLHFKKGRRKKTLKSPVEIEFACGCSCIV
jgi:Uma2 family endonuclease